MFTRLADRFLSPKVLLADRREYAAAGEFNLPAEPVEERRRDGCCLRGLRIGSGKDPHRPLAVFLPGNSANLSAHLLYVELLHRAGCDVLAFDYTGFGKSEGRPSLAGLLEDARSICAAAARLTASNRQKFGIFGVSLGANLALAAAAERRDVEAIAVEGLSLHRELVRGIFQTGEPGPRTIASIIDAGSPLPPREFFRLSGRRLPSFLAAPLAWLAHAVYPFAGKNPLRWMDRWSGIPVLIVHGTSDRLLPLEGALAVYQKLPWPKFLWLIPGAGHAQEPALAADGEYIAQLEALFHCRRQGDAEIDPGPPLTVQLRPGGEDGSYCIAAAGSGRLRFFRPWLLGGVPRTFELTEPCTVSAILKMRQTRRAGDSWEPVPTGRAALYHSSYAPSFNELSRQLHGGKLPEALLGLKRLMDPMPPHPFNFIARLHAARLEDLAQKQSPALAGEARRIFIELSAIRKEAPVP